MNSVVSKIWDIPENKIGVDMRREEKAIRYAGYDYIKTPIDNQLYFNCFRYVRVEMIQRYRK